jgi:hypothetical protein
MVHLHDILISITNLSSKWVINIWTVALPGSRSFFKFHSLESMTLGQIDTSECASLTGEKLLAHACLLSTDRAYALAFEAREQIA